MSIGKDEKKCSACGQTKFVFDFDKNKSRKSGYGSICKECRRKYRRRKECHKANNECSKRWRKANPEKVRRQQLKYSYGLTIEEYNQMFEQQKGCCAICGRHQSELKLTLGVDHNHTTGEIRKLLCRGCNSGIGHFNDDIELLLKAVNYLKEKETK